MGREVEDGMGFRGLLPSREDAMEERIWKQQKKEIDRLRAEVERLKAELMTVTDVLQYLYDNTEPHGGQWRHESKAAFRAAEAVLSANRDSEEE